ncbi:proteasome component (PCI) domain protein [Actinidia rufa]|uniref:Proteasome component (PCI) domain protein n=1 Tax=Actinidia rufa TaxID=165716 RepID=A0A7J0H248_9ERIC|nr:proteasome component (PCI) domain protein [Actinidia rufa]
MAALQYLDSLRNSHPELTDWYNTLSDLYQKKLWHQLTLKLEQFVALAVFQGVCLLIDGGFRSLTETGVRITLLGFGKLGFLEAEVLPE